MQTNFLLGDLKISDHARLTLKRIPFDLVCRHAINEHGQISDEERAANEVGMQTLGPIISRYRSDPTDPHSVNVVIKTSATWSETLIAIDGDTQDDTYTRDESVPF